MDKLTLHELRVIELAAHGFADKEIATKTNVSLCTVRTYWERVRKKLRVGNRCHAVSVAIALGLITVDLEYRVEPLNPEQPAALSEA